MPDIYLDVDVALAEVPVNLMPLIDDTTFKDIEAAVAYDAAGMALRWHFVTCAGAYTVTSVTPTTGGDYDWTDQGDSGVYTIEIPASGGASINNNTEGFGWFTGSATGILPWRGPVIGFRRAALNDMLIEGGTASTNLEDFFDGTGYAGGTAKLAVDTTLISGSSTTANNVKAVFATDFATNYDTTLDMWNVNAVRINGDAAAAAAAALYWANVETGTAQTGAAGTITLASAESSVDDFFNGAVIFITGGTGVGQYRKITDYVGSTRVATIDTNWVTTPDATSTYLITGRIT